MHCRHQQPSRAVERECIAAISSLAVAVWWQHASSVSSERLPPMGDMGSLLPAHLHIYIYGTDFRLFA